MVQRAQCAAIVTAAGASSRMGRPKALLAWAGRSLLAHQTHALAEFAEVVVVLGCHAEAIRAAPDTASGTRFVLNESWESGRSSSLVTGFAALTGAPEAVLVTGVDQPLDPSVVDTLLSAFEPAAEAFACPSVDGRRGHPLLLAGRLLPELLGLETLTEGLRTWTRNHRATSCEVPVADLGVLRDLNTPAQYEAAQLPRGLP